MRASRLARFACPAAWLLIAVGCGPKVVREPVFEGEHVKVSLRRTLVDDAPAPRGYDHPATISGVRMAHILASLSYEDRDGQTKPLVRTLHVYDLAEGISGALARAGPDDEVIARADAHDRRLGIFSDKRVTALRCVLVEGQLRLDFYAVEFDWQDADPRSESYEIPLELPSRSPAFKLVPGEAQAVAGPRSLLVDWRDDYYRKPVNLSIRYGQARRRTILMEGEAEDELQGPVEVPSQVTDAQIQALDQLDAARRSGILPEAEFQRRRRLILQGRLGEAGYEPSVSP